jgi:lipoyl(octanoyl) transferase
VTALEGAMAQPLLPSALCVAQARHAGVLIRCENPIPWSVAWALQQQIHAERLSGRRPDTLVLLEHLPVYTAGRGTKPSHLELSGPSLDGRMIPIEPVNRGGSITYHGPGQLVAYPIIALSEHAPGAKAYVHMLEEVLIRTLLQWDIYGYRVTKAPGIWIRHQRSEMKIASIGTRIDRGITLHGFALNVSNDLHPFSRIVPCGLDGCRMTSMAEIRQTDIAIPSVAEQLAFTFSAVFQLEWTTVITDGLTASGNETEPAAAASKEH